MGSAGPPRTSAARPGGGLPNQKEGPALTPRDRGLRCRQRPKLRAVPLPREWGKMLEECAAARREPLPTAGTRGAPDRHGRRTCRRSRLRPPDGAGGPEIQGPSRTSGALTSSPSQRRSQPRRSRSRRRSALSLRGSAAHRPPAQPSRARKAQGGFRPVRAKGSRPSKSRRSGHFM